jgi:hypothetical protein
MQLIDDLQKRWNLSVNLTFTGISLMILGCSSTISRFIPIKWFKFMCLVIFGISTMSSILIILDYIMTNKNKLSPFTIVKYVIDLIEILLWVFVHIVLMYCIIVHMKTLL